MEGLCILTVLLLQYNNTTYNWSITEVIEEEKTIFLCQNKQLFIYILAGLTAIIQKEKADEYGSGEAVVILNHSARHQC